LHYEDTTGLWNYEVMPPPPAIHSYEPATAQIQILDESLHPAGKIWPTFAALEFHLPYLVDGMKSTQVNFFFQIIIKKT